MEESSYRYWAFVSYSHADRRWGVWLHRKLESYKIPRAIVNEATGDKHIPARLFPCFIDEQEMPASGDLPGDIEQALALSRFLIVVCSPNSAKSRWVRREVETFKSMGREGRVLGLIVAGEPNASDKPGIDDALECFPAPMRIKYDGRGRATTEYTEPLAPDVRTGRESKHSAALRLVAGVAGIEYGRLTDRDRRRERARILTAVGVALAVIIAVCSLSVFALLQRKAARESRELTLHESYRSSIMQARQQVLAGKFSQAAAALWKAPVESSNWEWGLLALEIYPESLRLEGHNGWVQCASFSPDGKHVVTASNDATARVWDVATGQLARELIGHKGWVTHASFDPDGTRILTAANDFTARLWDAATGAEIREFHVSIGSVDHAYFSEDGDYIIAENGFDLRVWDAGTGEEIALRQGKWANLAVSRDMTFVAGTAPREYTVQIVNEDGEAVSTLTGHEHYIADIEFSPDGQKIATASYDSTARLWDVKSGAPLHVLKGHRGLLSHVSFSHAGNRLLTSSLDGSVRMWDVESGSLIHTYDQHEDSVLWAEFSPDGKQIVTASQDGVARLWNIQNAYEDRVLQHDSAVWSVDLDPPGGRVATGSSDAIVRIWNADSGELLNTLKGHETGVTAVAFNDEGTQLLSGDQGGTAHIWDLVTNEAIRTVQAEPFDIRRVEFGPAPNQFTTTTVLGVQIWDATTGQEIHKFEMNRDSTGHAGLSADGRFLALPSSSEANARMWDTHSGALVSQFAGTQNGAYAADISPDGQLVLTASLDGMLYVWNAASATTRYSVKSGSDCALFTPDGERIITGSAIFDAASGRRLAEMEFPTAISHESFSVDGRRLFMSGDENGLGLWDTEFGYMFVNLKGHTASLTDTAVCERGRRIVTSSSDGSARIYYAAPWLMQDLPQIEGTFEDPREERKARFFAWKHLQYTEGRKADLPPH